MNILYIAFKDFSKLHYGASKKVISECRALERLGYSVTLIGRDKTNTVLIETAGYSDVLTKHSPGFASMLQPVLDKNNQMADIQKYIQDKSYDLCYIRYDLSTAGFVNLVRSLKKKCRHIFIEIPTYPYDKEYSGSLNKLRLAADRFYAKKLHNYVDRIITFYEIPNNNFFGIPVKVVPNGFDFDEISIVKSKETTNALHIAAVSSMRHWHGYERLIEGLHNYYSQGGTREVYLYLVGNGREKSKYEALVEQYALEKHVVFCGSLFGSGLDNLLEKCNLGVDSLARHRTGIDTLSSLKSREYGAKGIPIINSCDIDILDDDFKYFLKVPADETPIDVQTVIDFFDNVYSGKDRQMVARDIRQYVEEKSGMTSVMTQIMSEVKE